MKNTIIGMTMALFVSFASAEETICPVKESQPWDKMKEKAFSKEAAIKQLQALNKLFLGEVEVAEEFVHQSNLIIEGAFYRMEIDTWKNDPKNYQYAKERFCKFMEESAYLVH